MDATDTIHQRSDGSKPKIIFVCTGNSCRSQMAEGLAREDLGAKFEFASAGVTPEPLNARAIRVMSELGINLDSHSSKRVDSVLGQTFDFLIVLCGNAHKKLCSLDLPADSTVLLFTFEDPFDLAASSESEQEALDAYRRIRDEIREFLKTLPEIVEACGHGEK